MGKQIIDLTGQRFGKLVALHLGVRTACNRVRWVCQCDCGNLTEVQSNDLRRGAVVSCGCYGKQVIAKMSRKHGDSHKTRLYNIWSGLRNRCNNRNHPRYADYGGRGVSVSTEWNDYTNFKTWAESHGYNDSLTIERIDNNSGYSADNCKWITLQEQSKNRRSSIIYKGKCLLEWTTLLNLPYHTIKSRIHRGWSIEKALNTPLLRRGYSAN